MANILPFSANITEETLIASIRLHNQFPPDTAFPQTDLLSTEFKELCAIIARYNAQRHFRLRLLHRHITIPKGYILLGTRIIDPCGYWTRLARIPDVDFQRVHMHIISVDTSSCVSDGEERNAPLLPSEFREDPASPININGNFFKEITNCLCTNGLENILGLETIQGQTEKMFEFSFGSGSLLLKEEAVKAEVRGQLETRETGWAINIKDGVVVKDGETRCVLTPTGHFQATKIQVKDALDAIKILRDQGVLA